MCKAYISENRSRHSGFVRATRASFFARLQRLSCFSLAIALVAAVGANAATVDVNVGPGLQYSPSTVNVTSGDTVRWVFQESSHTTTSNSNVGPEVWDSGIKAVGATFSHTFNTTGTFGYHCTVHGVMMSGSVHVAAPGPVIDDVSPSSGPVTGGTAVTISGSNFVADCTVSFGGTPAATSSFGSSQTINATTPAHAQGSVNVSVNCSTGNSTANNAFAFGLPGTPLASPAGLAALMIALAAAGIVVMRARS